jgi:hypothetical protein
VRSLANPKRSTAPSNGMDAKSSAGVPLSSPAAAQRCAEGAGLDSGAPAEAQSAMPSIAALTIASTADHLSPTPLPSMAPQLQSRISTSFEIPAAGLRFDHGNHFPVEPDGPIWTKRGVMGGSIGSNIGPRA